MSSKTSGVWFQSFIIGQEPQINTGANGLQRLDYVVKSAETNGIKLIINFVNNWADYGGMQAYNFYYGTIKPTWYTGMLFMKYIILSRKIFEVIYSQVNPS